MTLAPLIPGNGKVALGEFRLEPVVIATLNPGRRFRLYCGTRDEAPVTGRLLYLGSGSARVRIYRGFEYANFDDHNARHFNFQAQKTHDTDWSLGTLVIPEQEDDMSDGAPADLKPATKAKPKGEAKPKAEKKAKTKNPCECGCGTETGGRFAPGHDARWYGWAKKVVAGTPAKDIKDITAKGKKELADVKSAKAVLATSKH